jgi:hypothetical protein
LQPGVGVDLRLLWSLLMPPLPLNRVCSHSCARQRSGGLRAWSQRAHRYCLEKAIAAREGAAHRAALEALGDGAVRDVRIVEGLE